MTGFTSVCLHSLPASLTPDGCEAVPDPIGLAKVDLVGRLSIESVMGHFRVVVVPQSVPRGTNQAAREGGKEVLNEPLSIYGI